MKSSLLATGYQQLTADTDFTLQQHTTNAWGVNDDITFDYLYNTIANRTDTTERWFTTLLTLSSHEPFEVPFDRFPNDKIRNSFAYTDHCLGLFIDRLKQLPAWDNLLIICLPDHGILYREGGINSHNDPRMYHIPMLWIGGAVREALTIDRLTNQTDLPATLLAQLRLPHSDFTFSRNVLSNNYSYPFTFYTYNNALAFRDSSGLTIYSNEAERVIIDTPTPSPIRLKRGQAILQTVMDDLGSR
jgi:phosphoglycerol transferase MdoB-like AlkP superfamily enzyme